MGRHQQAEASGIISFMACATLAWIAMDLYLQFAPAIWRVTQRLFTVCAGITADVESSRSPWGMRATPGQ